MGLYSGKEQRCRRLLLSEGAETRIRGRNPKCQNVYDSKCAISSKRSSYEGAIGPSVLLPRLPSLRVREGAPLRGSPPGTDSVLCPGRNEGKNRIRGTNPNSQNIYDSKCVISTIRLLRVGGTLSLPLGATRVRLGLRADCRLYPTQRRPRLRRLRL